MTTSPRAYEATSKVLGHVPRVLITPGLHPELVERRAGELPELLKQIERTAAVGEIGIDGSSRFKSSLPIQRQVFEAAVSRSRELGGKVLSIHSRGAVKDVLTILLKHPGFGTAVLHWFTGTVAEMEAAYKMGCWFASSRWEPTIAVLHRLYDAREALSFTILDESGLKRLVEAASVHENVQTPYIPPRIWVYQVTRLRECLEEFIAHRAQIESCFNYCVDAYITNYKTLEAALGKKNSGRGPFTKGNDPLRERHYIGPFAETARRFGIEDLMRRWVVGWDDTRVSMFSSYLSLVTFAGQAYIANFTLQRREEVNSLRADCLIWENDEKLGRIPLIRGETTKTETDADARWVASPSVEIAVDALASIARLRMGCAVSHSTVQPNPADVTNPYLSSKPTEPWGSGIERLKPYDIRTQLPSIKYTLLRNPKFFDEAELRITSEDLKVARRITPNLPADEFAVGRVWPLAWHQYRRTAAVNMTASGVISNSSMQQQMKQATRIMPLYYGRGHTDLRLNDEVEQVIVAAMYEAMAFRLQEVVSDRFISPHSAERKDAMAVNLLAAKDVKSLAAWARQGKVSFRENRLGGCMKPGPCNYGGIESVARCGGGDGKAPCTDVVFDREREEQVRNQLHLVSGKMEQLSSEHPRYSALAAECKAMENYLNVVAANR